jgi:hypothetical protein
MKDKQNINKYKSPDKKLIKFFETSRDNWKSKCKEAKKNIKKLKNKTFFLKKSREDLKIQVKELNAELIQIKVKEEQKKEELKKKESLIEKMQGNIELFKAKPACHHYSVDHITLFITLVLSSATSLRCASRIINTVVIFFNFSVKCPSWFAGRLWLLRLGFYKLTRAKEKASDWVWIVDHTVQIGQEKCLVILGIRLSKLPCPNRCLSHEDVEPIALLPVKKSNGEIIYQQLKEVAEKTGVPREIISDKGTDLHAGIKQYCEEHPKTCAIYDIKHKSAVLLKKELKDDYVWHEFIKLSNETKKAIQQTELAHLCPPNQKAKSRYMNIDTLVKWGRKTQAFYDANDKGNFVEKQRLYEELGWISQFRKELKEWEELIEVASIIESFIRKEGIYIGCHDKLKQEKKLKKLGDRAKKFSSQYLDFVKKEESKVRLGERLLGSSEVIESVFGKLKRVEQDQGKSGFTGLLLSVAAMVSTTTRDVVQKAMETVPTSKVHDWCKKNIGTSIQAKRKKAFSLDGKAE